MTEAATTKAPPADEKESAPALPVNPRDAFARRRMSLTEQQVFLGRLLDRCKMHSGPHAEAFAGVATLTLSREDMAAIDCIDRTINLFQTYRADKYVAERAAKGGRK